MTNQLKRISQSTPGHDSDTPTTVAVPVAITHEPSVGAVPLSCDICGATTSRRGRKFTTQLDVVRHCIHMHPETRPDQPSASAKTRKPAAKASAHKVRTPGETAHAKFCPQCGFNLSVISAALSFVANHESI